MPKPGEYLSAKQKNGVPPDAAEIYKEIWLWPKQRGCENLVNKRLIESFAQAFAWRIQCEEAVSTYGLPGKHPTTGGVMESPFVKMSMRFPKNTNLAWYEIYSIVKENCTADYSGATRRTILWSVCFVRERDNAIFEKVNPCHQDKVADRIAGALVDLAYRKENDPPHCRGSPHWSRRVPHHCGDFRHAGRGGCYCRCSPHRRKTHRGLCGSAAGRSTLPTNRQTAPAAATTVSSRGCQ